VFRDLKPYFPACDRVKSIKVPAWVATGLSGCLRMEWDLPKGKRDERG